MKKKNLENYKKKIFVLSCAQGLSVTTMNIGIINSGLVGSILAPDKTYSTLPLSLQFLTLAILIFPVSILMGKYGRKIIFLLGVFFSIFGALIIALSILEKNFFYFIIGSIMLGISQATQQFYRYAATDNLPNKLKSKAISYVISGGLVAAFLGPELSKLSYDFFTNHLYLIAYIIAAFVQLLNLLLLFNLKKEKTYFNNQNNKSISKMLFNKKLIFAVFSASLGYSLMSFIMTATPLQIVNICKLGNDINANIIQWHVIAMFAPSLFTGQIINKFGNINVMKFGILFYFASIIIGTNGQTEIFFWFSLVFCGLGWNFLFVGGSDVIAKSTTSQDKSFVQGITDFIIFGSVAISSLSAGALHATIGWDFMLYISLIPIFFLSAYVVHLHYINRAIFFS